MAIQDIRQIDIFDDGRPICASVYIHSLESGHAE